MRSISGWGSTPSAGADPHPTCSLRCARRPPRKGEVKERTVADQDVLFENRGAIGLVTLNRPKALNALTHDMCVAMKAQLDLWARDIAVKAVVIQGAGERAFCAGGDIRSLYESGKAGTPYALDFYRDEYILNAAIRHYPKPYIAL